GDDAPRADARLVKECADPRPPRVVAEGANELSSDGAVAQAGNGAVAQAGDGAVAQAGDADRDVERAAADGRVADPLAVALPFKQVDQRLADHHRVLDHVRWRGYTAGLRASADCATGIVGSIVPVTKMACQTQNMSTVQILREWSASFLRCPRSMSR